MYGTVSCVISNKPRILSPPPSPKSSRFRDLRTLQLSLRSFFASRRLFSATCGLFLQNTRGGGYAQKLAFRISDFQTLSCPERGMRRVPHPGGTFVASEHPAKDANPERPSGVEGSQPRRSPSAPAPRSLRYHLPRFCSPFVFIFL